MKAILSRFAAAVSCAAFVGLWTGIFLTTPAEGQLVVGGGKKMAQPPPPPKKEPGSASQFSAIKLIEKSEYRQYINVAREAIRDKEWGDAITAVQLILDNKEDFYVQLREIDPTGREVLRWTSVKFEANNLLGTLPDEGLDVYEQRFGAVAQNKLNEAKSTGNRDLLAEVATRFLHTRAGIDANDLLATYFLDRGQFFMAALRYEKLLQMNPARVKIDDLTLFKAALAFRRAEEMKKYTDTWQKLEAKLRDKGGLTVGEDLYPIAKLQQALDEFPRPEMASPFDWPYIRGNVTHSAQAQGSPPLLDVIVFDRPLVLDKNDDGEVEDKGREAKTRVDSAMSQLQGYGNMPVLPGFFPIASNNRLIYRTHLDVRAVYLKDDKDPYSGELKKAGSIAWKTTELDGALANVLSDTKMKTTLENWLTRYFAMPGFSNIVFENSLLGTLSTDNRLVYAVDDLAVPVPGDQIQQFTWNSGNIAADVKPLVLQNSLFAIDLISGKCIWKLGGGSKDDPFADSHFLGVPISVGGKLYVLNEKNNGIQGDSDLRLVCIDPYKMAGPSRPSVIEPIQSLGFVQQQHRITHDVSRRVNAVHLGYGEGILVCPTNAGEVLGVDLLTRSLVWSYPYREHSPQPVAMPNPQPQPFPQQKGYSTTASNWHSTPPVLAEGRVVFTAPDASSVHCINLRDGTPVWKKKQSDNDLYLAGVYNGKVLIVGKSAIRALSLEDGRQLWYLPTSDMPSGQGVAAKDIYYLPLKKGEIMAVDINRGLVKAHNRAKTAIEAPGNLVFYEGAVLSQSATKIVAYPQLAARLQLAHAALQADPNNAEKLVDRGELLLADGQVQGAVDDLQLALARKPADPLAGRAKSRLYDALTDLLQVDFNNASTKYLDEYRQLCSVPDNVTVQQTRLARYYRIVGQGREAQGNLVDAFQMYREFGALPIHNQEGGVASLDDPTHKVPTHVWLRGRVSAMIAKATAEQRAPLERKIEEEWKQVEAKKDLDAIRSFVGMFDVPFVVGREARLQLADTIMERNERSSFLEAELNLQQLRGPEYRKDPKFGGRALASLALLEEKKGSVDSMKLAAAYYRDLYRDFANVAVRTDKTGQRTGADLFNDLATDPRFRPYLEESAVNWSGAKIAARELPASGINSSLQGFIFQPEGELTPLMKQHRLILDPSNQNNPQLRFVNLSDNSVRWQQTLGSQKINLEFFKYLYQQAQNSNTAFHPNARFRFYQVQGHLLVFQVGSMAYCLDADNAKILWQHPLVEGSLPAQPGMIAQQVVPDEDGYLDLIIWNQFNGQRTRSPIGHVGAVQASYVALVTQKGLLVLDPIRGSMHWKKTDVSPGTRVFGDDAYLFLVESSDGAAGSGRVLRASDGMEINAPDFGGVYQNKVRILGRRILSASPKADGTTLRLYDVLSGKDIWTKNFAPKSVVLETEDPTLTGVIEPSGTIVALEAETGREILKGSVLHGRIGQEDLKDLKRPMLLRDAERYYVALNRAVDSTKVAGAVLANNFSNGLRCAAVNGWVLALHRLPGEKKSGDKTVAWKAGDFAWHSYTPLHHQMIVLEQFDQLPVLLFTSRFNELIKGGAGGNRWVSLTQSIHKRTGKVIFDPGSRPSNSAAQFYAFNLEPRNGTINMIGFGSTLQHYIDDGRKPADPPNMTGAGVSAVGNPYGPGGLNPYLPVQPGIDAGVMPLPVRRVAPLIKLNQKVEEKK
ncbi:MAG: PQQ-binding-like beta-propeller repeat protein [Gemmataceae bacterium]|nr:PQQ-binding-like beta-propeller repeat protein [Gemmataceae bacterium]MCI0743424.1 PQQ-binding-like beta-propeller repeat protein [Gemmataceae bacterium]